MKVLVGEKTGKRWCVPHLSEVMEAIEADCSIGFCLACGEQAEGVEPDASGHECDACGKRKVYGAEQVLLFGLYCND